MKRQFKLKAEIPATPEQVFRAWISSDGHSAMTGNPAKVDPRIGGVFTAWDGYITGKTLELVPHSRIVQAWRTGEFAESDPDSRLVIELEAIPSGTLLTLTHSEIPAEQVDSYRKGWEEWYFAPMGEYFKQQRGKAR